MTHESFKRIERIDQLIRIKGTGTAEQLAEKLGISRRSVFNLLNEMKEKGAPIKYDQYRGSYYYDEEGYFKIAIYFKRKEVYVQVKN
jgi:predicted DNA-binding transcriptional regulator YafY